MRTRLLTTIAALVGTLAFASQAQAAAKITNPSNVGDYNDVFQFFGSGWARGQRVTIEYFESLAARSPTKSFSVTPGRSGRFLFRLVQPVVTVDQGRTEKVCFRQGRTQRCAPFYVQPTRARVEPADGRPGDTFLLQVSGWRPGDRLIVEVTAPNGALTLGGITTRTASNGFIDAGQPFGVIFVPRGGGFLRFDVPSDAQLGVYGVFIHRSGEARGSRTAFRVNAT